MKNEKIRKKALEEKENMAKNIYLIILIRCLIKIYVGEFEKTKQRKCWLPLFKAYICLGSKDYATSDIPINSIRSEVCKENGEKKYDRDL